MALTVLLISATTAQSPYIISVHRRPIVKEGTVYALWHHHAHLPGQSYTSIRGNCSDKSLDMEEAKEEVDDHCQNKSNAQESGP